MAIEDIVANQPEKQIAEPEIIQNSDTQNSQITGAFNLVRAYINQHPEALQSLAPDFFDEINDAIDAAPAVLGLRQELYKKVPWAKIILGDQQDPKDRSRRTNYIDDEDYEDEPEERPRTRHNSSVLTMAVDDALKLLDSGVAPRDVAENINDVYDLDWSYQTVNRLMMRRPLIQGNNGSGRTNLTEQEIKLRNTLKVLYDENKVLRTKVTEKPQIGLIRKILRALW